MMTCSTWMVWAATDGMHRSSRIWCRCHVGVMTDTSAMTWFLLGASVVACLLWLARWVWGVVWFRHEMSNISAGHNLASGRDGGAGLPPQDGDDVPGPLDQGWSFVGPINVGQHGPNGEPRTDVDAGPESARVQAPQEPAS